MSLETILTLLPHPTNPAAPARYVKADPGTAVGRAAIARAIGFQVVATLASKARLTVQAGRLDHFKGWTGITAEVAENGDGKAIWTVTGIPVGYGPMWYVLIDRLAGKTEIRREALTSYDRPSDVARQFVQQFLPALGAEDGHGSAYTRNGGRSNWMLAEGFATLEPIMIHAGMIPATHRPKPARRKG
jgi:hypothetical protein